MTLKVRDKSRNRTAITDNTHINLKTKKQNEGKANKDKKQLFIITDHEADSIRICLIKSDTAYSIHPK